MNIIYKTSDINESELLNILKLWNDEKGRVYPIPTKAFYQNVINYIDKDVMVAYDKDKLVGFIILKRFDDKKYIDYTDSLFISLFLVSKKYRKNGIGTQLLEYANKIKNGRKLVIGKDINNFFPGVPTDFDNLTDVWLEKRGFVGKRYTHDLICYEPQVYPIKNNEIIYMYCNDETKDELINFLQKNNWKRWAYEADDYFKNKTVNDEESYIIGLKKDVIVSFVKINTHKMNMTPYNVLFQERFNNLGGIGPLGVDNQLRKNGLGADMMSIAISKLKEKGVKDIIIDWTGLMEIYYKYGFEVWKSYKYMETLK